eukprot:scaffold20566_cov32-Tisochrysis_lutea.AAC.3
MITSFFKPKHTPKAEAAVESVDQPEPQTETPAASPSDPACAKPVAMETEVQQPGRKRLRKAVICDDDDDASMEVPVQPAAAEQPLVSCVPTTAAEVDRAPESSRVDDSAVQSSNDSLPEDSPCDGRRPSKVHLEDNKLVEAVTEPSERKPLTLFGAGAVAKVAGSAAKGRASLLDLKAYLSYDPQAEATWSKGADVPFAYLTTIFTKIEAESKRLLITQLMANCFRTVIATSPQQLHATICVATNKIAASYEGLELGVGDTIMIKAVAETCGKSVDAVKTQLEEEGDLGVVAASARRKQITFGKPKPLMVKSVLANFIELAKASGKDVMTRKKEKIKQMLVAAQGSEAQYIVRALQGKMRIGLAEQTVLVALAHAVVLTPPPITASDDKIDLGEPLPFAPGGPGGLGGKLPKGEALVALLAEAEAIIKRVYCEMPNYEVITRVLLAHGLANLHKHAHLTTGIPVKPMLAKPTKGISEVSAESMRWFFRGSASTSKLFSLPSLRLLLRRSANRRRNLRSAFTSSYPAVRCSIVFHPAASHASSSMTASEPKFIC